MKYVYTLRNIKVFLLSCYLRKKGKPKVFRLLGESGSGKSTFVKEFVDKRNDCLLIRGETMNELFFDYLSGGDTAAFIPSNTRYLIIENFEDIKNIACRRFAAEFVDHCCSNGMIVLITECRNYLLDFNVYYPVEIVLFNSIRPSVRVIWKIARFHNVHINLKQMRMLLNEYNTMSGLENKIIRIGA